MDKKESKLLIDTDVLINFFDRTIKSYRLLKCFLEFSDRNVEPCISIITDIEMIQGSKNNLEKNRILKQMESFGQYFSF